MQGAVVWFLLAAEACLRTERIIASLMGPLGVTASSAIDVRRATSEWDCCWLLMQATSGIYGGRVEGRYGRET
jgi:hypothetical protein